VNAANKNRQGDGWRPLQGQKALVTGANSGIGSAVALALGAAGADVGVNYVSRPEAADAVVEQIRKAGTDAIALEADVSNEDQVVAMFRNVIERFGRLDILVANAGVQRDAPFVDMTLADWNTVIAINLTGQFLCCREAVRAMSQRGVTDGVSKAAGKIICMSSVHERIPWAGHINYAASKGGLMMMMQSLAQEGRAAEDPRQFDRAGRHPHPDQYRRLVDAGGLCRADDAGALRPDRRAGGRRPRRGVARLGGI
jgi:glucose 1-dehydrogenase